MTDIFILAVWYIWMGLITLTVYMTIVGRFIADKYDCGLMEGIGRFELAGSAISNLRAVGRCLLTWPKILKSMLFGNGQAVLQEMVEENDY